MRLSETIAVRRIAAVVLCLFLSFHSRGAALGGDWPMWRYDAGRSAASADALPERLHPVWTRQFSPRVPVWDDPLNRDLMPYDRSFEPIVADNRMFLGFNDADKVIAIDTSSGLTLWTFYTDGPVRFPPVAYRQKVFFTSDDGYLYCVHAFDGKLIWKHRGGPSDRRILGNQRLISAWPARGGPVVADGVVYYAASIWPFMGTFIHALDAETGKVVWLNDSTSATFIDQPHNSPAFAGVAPQGALALVGKTLFVPGGRSVPAGFDRASGKQLYFHLAKYNKVGGSNVFAAGDYFYAHERVREYSVFSAATGEKAYENRLGQPVVTPTVVYASGTSITAYRVEDLKPIGGKPKSGLAAKAKSALSGLTGDDDDDDHDSSSKSNDKAGDKDKKDDATKKDGTTKDEKKTDEKKADEKAAGDKKPDAKVDDKKKDDKAGSSLDDQLDAGNTADPKNTDPKGAPANEPAKKDDKAADKKEVKPDDKKDAKKDDKKDSTKDDKKDDKKDKTPPFVQKTLWTIKVDATGDMIKAGRRLYAAGKSGITVVEESADGTSAKIVDTINVKGTIERLIAGNGMLFAVTADGAIHAFGVGSPAEPVGNAAPPEPDAAALEAAKAKAKTILERTRVADGYALVFGIGDGNLLAALADASQLKLIGFDPDAAKVRQARARFDAAGLYGGRIAVHEGTPRELLLPPYLASLIVIGDPAAVRMTASEDFLAPIFEMLRPYGGKAWLPINEADQEAFLLDKPADVRLPKANWRRTAEGMMLERPGSLEGSAPWTHIHGSLANTIKSDDRLVKLPLGLLWFGGNSNLDVLPRHGHGPPEQVIGGRLFIQGMESLSARDVYTGRVLWRSHLPKLGNFGVYFDETYKDEPTSTAYNQVHIPGANSRGTNFVVTEDRAYILQGNECHVLATESGKTLDVFRMSGRPAAAKPDPLTDWAYLGVYQNLLIGGDGFASFGAPAKSKDGKSAWRFMDYERVASRALVVMDRLTGKELWRLPAKIGIIHNGIAAADGTLFVLDKAPPYIEQKLKRQGKPALAGARLMALDINTGKLKWETSTDVFGSWLSYSPEHKVLLQSTRPSRDMTLGEDGKRMIVYDAATGRVKWNKDVGYTEPPILHGDRILAGGRGYELLSGDAVMRDDPLTGKKIPWSYTRSYGCNYPVAAENLLTFRSAAAGFYDLTNDGGVGNFGGFKSSCSSNLVAADGVLNAPDYTRTCTCSYQNQTSLAFIHMPELEMWTRNDYAYRGGAVRQIGVNLGAPGDRRSPEGTLWLEFPSRGAPSPKVPIDVSGDAKYFHRNAQSLNPGGIPWVASSGVEGEVNVRITLDSKSDPTLGDGIAIAASADDAEETRLGRVRLDSSDLELVTDLSPQLVGLRFNGVDMPSGVDIEEAYVQFSADEKSTDPTDLVIQAEDVDNATAFIAETHNLSKRQRTKAQVVWKPEPWNKVDEHAKIERTPDLKPVIEAILGRTGWKAGNSLVLFISGKGKRIAKSFDGKAELAPRLVIRVAGRTEPLISMPDGAPRYKVRLHFAEPEDLTPGARVFDVIMQGQRVLDDFDAVVAAGGAHRAVVREFAGVPVQGVLSIQLKANTTRAPILCGVEAIAE